MKYASGLNPGEKKKVASQLTKLYAIPKNYFTLRNYPRVLLVRPSDLPVLKVALQVSCGRNEGTIGVKPAELVRVLTERGGYSEDDSIFVIFKSGEKLMLKLSTIRHIIPEKVEKIMFAVSKAENSRKAPLTHKCIQTITCV